MFRSQSCGRRVQFLVAAAAIAFTAASTTSPARADPMITTVVSFDGDNGSRPLAGLMIDASGNLFGTTSQGGASGLGTVFRIDAVGNFTTLASFDGDNGSSPQAGVIADAAGNLYGTTHAGGPSGEGTVFKLDPADGAVTTLASFDGGNGSQPEAGLIRSASGNLYGMAHEGGDGYGTVFKVDPAGNLMTLLSFDGADGRYPSGSLTPGASGELYGITASGAVSGEGTVFRIDSADNVATVASFDRVSDGGGAEGPLTPDGHGLFYGAASEFGDHGAGTVFKFDPQTGAITALASFDADNDGANTPNGGLVIDAAGNLYGTTYGGGAYGGILGDGTIFKFDAATGTISTLISFDGAHGANPLAGLIADAQGNLYGTTNGGGDHGLGTVFKITGVGFVIPEPATGAVALITLGAAALPRRGRRRP